MMKEECVIPGTFPLFTMSIEELVSCATRPFRIHAALIQQKTASLSAVNFSLAHQPVDSNDPWLEYGADSAVLLPGGRWFITAAANRFGMSLFCWDLMLVTTSGGVQMLTPVASCALKDSPTTIALEGRDVTIKAQSIPENGGANLLVCGRNRQTQ